MKSVLLILSLFVFLNLKAQQENKAPADSIFAGKIINDKSQNTRIYLTGFQQTIDSTGAYTTTYIFGAKTSRPVFEVGIQMKFDSPLLPDGPIGLEYGPLGPGRFSGSGGVRNTNYLSLRGTFTASGHHFYIRVKSNQKPNSVIYGIEGQDKF